MTVWYLEALTGIALFSILMALAWMVQRRTGNSGWVDTLRTFSLGLTGARSFRCHRKHHLEQEDRGSAKWGPGFRKRSCLG